MTSSTKPEVRNILHCRQRKTEPRPQVTCSENLANFRHVDFEIYERADRQTDLLTEKHFCHTMRTLFALIPTVLSSTRRNMKVYGCVVLVITFLVPSVHSDRGKQHQQLDAFSPPSKRSTAAATGAISAVQLQLTRPVMGRFIYLYSSLS